MAKGLPDWHSQIRVFQGIPSRQNLDHTFAAKGTHDFALIEGKGVILGGHIYHVGAVSHKTCMVTLTIDDSIMGSARFHSMFDYYNSVMPGYPFSLTLYDESSFEYVMNFDPGWIFDENIQVKITEEVAASAWKGWLLYALLG